MKPISPTPHGVIDYAVGLLLLVSPWLFGFDEVSAATYTMVVLGFVTLGLSLLTNYPLGLIKAIPFPTHGILETIGAIVLLVSPWLLGFSEVGAATTLALVLGIGWLAVVALTNYKAYEAAHYR